MDYINSSIEKINEIYIKQWTSLKCLLYLLGNIKAEELSIVDLIYHNIKIDKIENTLKRYTIDAKKIILTNVSTDIVLYLLNRYNFTESTSFYCMFFKDYYTVPLLSRFINELNRVYNESTSSLTFFFRKVNLILDLYTEAEKKEIVEIFKPLKFKFGFEIQEKLSDEHLGILLSFDKLECIYLWRISWKRWLSYIKSSDNRLKFTGYSLIIYNVDFSALSELDENNTANPALNIDAEETSFTAIGSKKRKNEDSTTSSDSEKILELKQENFKKVKQLMLESIGSQLNNDCSLLKKAIAICLKYFLELEQIIIEDVLVERDQVMARIFEMEKNLMLYCNTTSKDLVSLKAGKIMRETLKHRLFLADNDLSNPEFLAHYTDEEMKKNLLLIQHNTAINLNKAIKANPKLLNTIKSKLSDKEHPKERKMYAVIDKCISSIEESLVQKDSCSQCRIKYSELKNKYKNICILPCCERILCYTNECFGNFLYKLSSAVITIGKKPNYDNASSIIKLNNGNASTNTGAEEVKDIIGAKLSNDSNRLFLCPFCRKATLLEQNENNYLAIFQAISSNSSDQKYSLNSFYLAKRAENVRATLVLDFKIRLFKPV